MQLPDKWYSSLNYIYINDLTFKMYMSTQNVLFCLNLFFYYFEPTGGLRLKKKNIRDMISNVHIYLKNSISSWLIFLLYLTNRQLKIQNGTVREMIYIFNGIFF